MTMCCSWSARACVPTRPSRLEYRDVSVVRDADTGERILEIEVRGKRGVGFCKSLPTAVAPFQRMRKRSEPKATDLLFGAIQRELMNAVLAELDLKHDREGNARTAYSLRHTYICQRLMEGRPTSIRSPRTAAPAST